jgi:hypothetical protein
MGEGERKLVIPPITFSRADRNSGMARESLVWRRPLLLACAVGAMAGAMMLAEGAPPQDYSAAFKRIQALAGDWTGTMEWSGARTDKGTMKASYYVTGHGTAVVENLLVDTEPIMTSVYHMDNGILRMTHYCGAGNQPRLRAEGVDDHAGTVRFALVDITNLSGPKAPHVEAFEIQFVDDNHIVLTFGFVANDTVSRERIDLRRTGR